MSRKQNAEGTTLLLLLLQFPQILQSFPLFHPFDPAQSSLPHQSFFGLGMVKFSPARIKQNTRLLNPSGKTPKHCGRCFSFFSSYLYHNATTKLRILTKLRIFYIAIRTFHIYSYIRSNDYTSTFLSSVLAHPPNKCKCR
mgnify:CR=1 FL=1